MTETTHGCGNSWDLDSALVWGGGVGRTCSLVLSNPVPHSRLSLDTHQSGVGGDLTTDARRGDQPSTPEGDRVCAVFSLVEECRFSFRYSEAMGVI